MSILTELSYLNCTIGGKISVDYHGQKIKIGFMNLQRADSELLNQVMPGLELQEYIEEQDIVLEGETEKREEVGALSDKTPQILKAVLLDNTGNLLEKVLSYGESFILRILTHNMKGKSLNFSFYNVVNEKEIEAGSNGKPLKVEQDNGIVKSDLIHLNIGMPMKTRQDMGAETHQYRLRIFNEDRTLVQEARFNVKNQKVDSQFIPPDIQVPVKVGKLSNIGKEEKEEEETTKEAYIIILSGKGHPQHKYIIESFKYEDGTLYEQTGYEEYSTKPYTGKLPSHMQKVKDDLDKLALNIEGKKLMDFFQKGKYRTTVYIPTDEDKLRAKENNERPRNNSGFSGVVYQGEAMELPMQGERFGVSVPSYIILAHELGHAQSFRMGVQNHSYWFNDVMIEEIWGTHVENKVRISAGIKLRDTYELDKLNTKTQMIDSNGNSLYINKNESYPQNPPQRVSLENAFNYNSIK